MKENFFLVKVTTAPETRFSGDFSDTAVIDYIEARLSAALAFYTEGPQPLVQCSAIDATQHGDTARILKGGS